MIGDSLHFHAIAANYPLESKGVSQEPLQDARREGSREKIGFRGGESHVGGHDGGDPFGNEPLERKEFDAFQPFHIVGNEGNIEMGIDGGIAMAGKMLGCGGHAACPQASGEGRG
jgi:hypothetical protein